MHKIKKQIRCCWATGMSKTENRSGAVGLFGMSKLENKTDQVLPGLLVYIKWRIKQIRSCWAIRTSLKKFLLSATGNLVCLK